MTQRNSCDFHSSYRVVENQTAPSSAKHNKLRETKGNPLLPAKTLPRQDPSTEHLLALCLVSWPKADEAAAPAAALTVVALTTLQQPNRSAFKWQQRTHQPRHRDDTTLGPTLPFLLPSASVTANSASGQEGCPWSPSLRSPHIQRCRDWKSCTWEGWWGKTNSLITFLVASNHQVSAGRCTATVPYNAFLETIFKSFGP